MRLLRRRKPARGRRAPVRDQPDPRIVDLERRLEHLEAAFEGLQDSVHREASRHDKRMHDLERATQPAEIARSLSADARRRGI
jgi:hypothetical protein